MADLGKSAGAICDIVETYTSNTTANNALGYLNDGYRAGLQGVDPRTGIVHLWSFLRKPHYVLTLSAHKSGTAVGQGTYSATTGYTTLTAAAAVFVPSMIGGELTFATSGTAYDVVRFTSTTVIVLNGNASAETSGDTFTVDNGGYEALPADFGGVVGPVVYTNHDNEWLDDWREVDESMLNALYRDDYEQDVPRYWCIASETFAAGTGERFAFRFWPPTDEDRMVRIPYRRLVDVLTDETTVYPVGGPEFSMLWQTLALAEAEIQRGAGKPGPWQEKARERMIAMIDFDARLLGAADAPVSLAEQDNGLGWPGLSKSRLRARASR